MQLLKKLEPKNSPTTVIFVPNKSRKERKWKSREDSRLREMLRGKPKHRRHRKRESRRMPRNRGLRKLQGRRENSLRLVEARRRRLSLDILLELMMLVERLKKVKSFKERKLTKRKKCMMVEMLKKLKRPLQRMPLQMRKLQQRSQGPLPQLQKMLATT